MRLFLIVVLQLAVALVFTKDAKAQNITNSTVSGRLVSASATLEPPNSSVVVFTTPEAGFFILTQYCAGNVGAGITPLSLRGSTFGIIVTSGQNCTSYVPGIAIPQGETLSCISPFGPVGNPIDCMVTGVLSEQ